MLEIKFSNLSMKFLKKCENELYDRLILKIKNLSREPFPSDCKRIERVKEKVFRVRVGGYRILYEVFYEENIVLISEINKREKIY